MRDLASFERHLNGYLLDHNRPLLILLNIDRHAARVAHDVIALLHYFAADHPDAVQSRLQFIAADDYSFWFFQHYVADFDLSALYLLKEFTLSTLSEGDTLRVIETLSGQHLGDAPSSGPVPSIYGATGGHIGLTRELCFDLQTRDWDLSSNSIHGAVERLPRESAVLESIRRDIQDNPIGIAATALEFTSAKYPTEYSSPRYQFLRQIGVLEWVSESQARLCGGAIARLFTDLAAQEETRRVGTLGTLGGLRRFETADFQIGDDDFVILHLSDLHVGDEHRFRLDYSGHCENEGVNPLAKLISEDIARMSLSGRVDAVVISGDLVCNGSFEEFARAREVVVDVVKLVGLGPDRVIIVPGNHDVEWNPGKFAAKSVVGQGVSREAFDAFLELLGQRPRLLPGIKQIPSRHGGRRLDIIGLDSNFVEGPDAAGIGFVAKESLDEAARLVDEVADGDCAPIRWIVVHHHVLPVASASLLRARQRSVSVMGNAPEVLSRAMKWGVEVLLHGHEHHPVVTWAQRWLGEGGERDFRPIIVIGAGSCGAKRECLGPVSRNQYYLLVRTQSSLVIRSRVLSEEELDFVAHNDLVIDLPEEGWREGSRKADRDMAEGVGGSPSASVLTLSARKAG